MRHSPARAYISLLILATTFTISARQSLPEPTPRDPRDVVIDAFRTHDIVALSDPHGLVDQQRFLLSLIKDSRVTATFDDVVMETLSARYQDAVDRYVRGDDVPRATLRHAWEDHTVANSTGLQAEEMIETVRALNRATPNHRLRVVAGDPPIDWENITSVEDHRRWIDLRDSYPADVIRHQVLERGRKALVVYGQGHLQRRQIASNYDMSLWQEQTVVSLLERDAATHLFNVWTLLDANVALPAEVQRWRIPSLALLRGTSVGARDFGEFSQGLDDATRFAVQDGRLVPLPRDQWRKMRMEDEFDGLLYLGPPSAFTTVEMPASLCADKAYVATRLTRLALAAPPVELANFKKACGGESALPGR